MTKLHLGCGTKVIPGFVHVDAIPYPHVDHVSDVSRLAFAADGSVDLIYACHVLEHFGRHRFRDALAEWHRVLRVGGVLRLAVPDFRAVAEWYLRDPRATGIDEVLGLCVGGQRDEYDSHLMIFDTANLTAALRSVGFSAIRPWDWRTTEHSGLDDYSQSYLPHMDKDHGRLMSLNLEAVK